MLELTRRNTILSKHGACHESTKRGRNRRVHLEVGDGTLFVAIRSAFSYQALPYRPLIVATSPQTPAPKWQTSDISSMNMEKHKCLETNFTDGAEPLRFHSKNAAEATKTKIGSSRALPGAPLLPNGDESPHPSKDPRVISKCSCGGHSSTSFSSSQSSPLCYHNSEVPPGEGTEDEETKEECHETWNQAGIQKTRSEDMKTMRIQTVMLIKLSLYQASWIRYRRL